MRFPEEPVHFPTPEDPSVFTPPRRQDKGAIHSDDALVPPRPWGLGAVLAAIVTALAFLGLGLLLLLLTVSEENADSAFVFNVSLAVLVVVIAATAWVFGPAMHGGGLRSLGLRPPQIAGNAPWLLPPLVLLAVLLFNAAYTSVVTALGIEVLQPQDLPFDDYGVLALVFSGILVALAGPFAEELFFRGLVLRGLTHRWGPAVGILVSAAIFSVAHANVAILRLWR